MNYIMNKIILLILIKLIFYILILYLFYSFFSKYRKNKFPLIFNNQYKNFILIDI